jgi:hypothetical protein
MFISLHIIHKQLKREKRGVGTGGERESGREVRSMRESGREGGRKGRRARARARKRERETAIHEPDTRAHINKHTHTHTHTQYVVSASEPQKTKS